MANGNSSLVKSDESKHAELIASENPLNSEVKFWTSLKNDTFADKALIFKAMQDADFDSVSIEGAVFRVQHVLLHPAEKVNAKTGELEKWKRIVLIDPSGATLSFGSEGVYRAIGTLIYLFGKPPWQNGIPVKLRRTRKKDMGEWFTLDLCEEGG